MEPHQPGDCTGAEGRQLEDLVRDDELDKELQFHLDERIKRIPVCLAHRSAHRLSGRAASRPPLGGEMIFCVACDVASLI